MRRLASLLLLLLAAGPLLVPERLAEEDREAVRSAPTGEHPLGTDALGRDNLYRYLRGMRMSLSGACAAAVVATGIGLLAGFLLSRLGRAGMAFWGPALDTFQSMPWYLLVFLVRAWTPLDTGPEQLTVILFGMLATFSWAAAARTVAAACRQLRQEPWAAFARASGMGGAQMFRRHYWPHLVPLARVHFLMLTPAILLAESSLGLLGLGVPDSAPSLGSSLTDLLQPGARWWEAAPLLLLLTAVLSLQTISRRPTDESKRT
jgi:peptide/nickel transport system permease protein